MNLLKELGSKVILLFSDPAKNDIFHLSLSKNEKELSLVRKFSESNEMFKVNFRDLDLFLGSDKNSSDSKLINA